MVVVLRLNIPSMPHKAGSGGSANAIISGNSPYKLSGDREAANSFIPEFQKIVADGEYSAEQIFNCDESGFYYKLLPTKTMAAHFEKTAAGRKAQNASKWTWM